MDYSILFRSIHVRYVVHIAIALACFSFAIGGLWYAVKMSRLVFLKKEDASEIWTIGIFILLVVLLVVVGNEYGRNVIADLPYVYENNYNKVTGVAVDQTSIGDVSESRGITILDKATGTRVTVRAYRKSVDIGKEYTAIYLPNTKVGVVIEPDDM